MLIVKCHDSIHQMSQKKKQTNIFAKIYLFFSEYRSTFIV